MKVILRMIEKKEREPATKFPVLSLIGIESFTLLILSIVFGLDEGDQNRI